MTSFFFVIVLFLIFLDFQMFPDFLNVLMFLYVLNHKTGRVATDELRFVFHSSEGELVNNKFKGDKVHNDKG